MILELETEIQEIESDQTTTPNQTKNDPKLNTLSITDLMATLKNVKTEEKQLLNQTKELKTLEQALSS